MARPGDPPICRDFRRRRRPSAVAENRGVPSSSLGLAIGEDPADLHRGAARGAPCAAV